MQYGKVGRSANIDFHVFLSKLSTRKLRNGNAQQIVKVKIVNSFLDL
jgi:hypothetical protein